MNFYIYSVKIATEKLNNDLTMTIILENQDNDSRAWFRDKTRVFNKFNDRWTNMITGSENIIRHFYELDYQELNFFAEHFQGELRTCSSKDTRVSIGKFDSRWSTMAYADLRDAFLTARCIALLFIASFYSAVYFLMGTSL